MEMKDVPVANIKVQHARSTLSNALFRHISLLGVTLTNAGFRDENNVCTTFISVTVELWESPGTSTCHISFPLSEH